MGHAPLAHDGCHQGRLLAADKGPRAFFDGYIKGKARPQDVIPQQAKAAGLVDGDLEPADGQGVFGPDIEEAVGGPDGISADDESFQDSMGISLQETPVHEGPRVSFIRIANNIFRLPRGFSGQLPLAARGKTGPAPAPQARLADGFNDLFRSHVPQSPN